MKKHLWILEDDPGARFVYQEVLEPYYRVTFFESLNSFKESGKEMTKESHGDQPDLIVADLRLQDDNFLNLLERDRARSSIRAPFIVVSSVDDLNVLRSCFEEGALDYLTKPFTKNELIAKVERVLKLGENLKQPPPGELTVEPAQMRVKRGEESFAQLTAKELQIFSVLHREPGKRVSRARLQKEVWGDVNVGGKALDVHLFNLRRKVAVLGVEILYEAEDGYMLVVNPDISAAKK